MKTAQQQTDRTFETGASQSDSEQACSVECMANASATVYQDVAARRAMLTCTQCSMSKQRGLKNCLVGRSTNAVVCTGTGACVYGGACIRVEHMQLVNKQGDIGYALLVLSLTLNLPHRFGMDTFDVLHSVVQTHILYCFYKARCRLSVQQRCIVSCVHLW